MSTESQPPTYADVVQGLTAPGAPFETVPFDAKHLG